MGDLPTTLRELRQGRSQEEMAARLGHSQAWWSLTESGNRNPGIAEIEWLSRKEGLALIRGDWRIDELLVERLERAEAALGWYADDERYRGHDPEVLLDVGERAREALALPEQEPT